VLLEQIAEIEDGLQDRLGYVRLNGQEAVVAVVFRRSDANTVNVSDDLMSQLDYIGESYGDMVDINVMYTQASFVKGSISNLWSSALQALVLSVIVLLIFLRPWRSSAAVAISIPMSIIATFAVMHFTDVDLNIVSLAGLALAVGMLVDNSIVVLESIVRHREEGGEAKESAVKGANEVGMAITASTLTTVAVFVPVLFVPGLAGQIFRDMSLTISFSLIMSLFVALSLIPMYTSRIRNLAGNGRESRIQRTVRQVIDAMTEKYFTTVQWTLARKKLTILTSAGVFVLSMALMAFVQVEFFPTSDEGYISANTFRSPGTVLGETESTARIIQSGVASIVDSSDIEEFYMEVGQLEGFAAAFGSSGSNNLNFFLTLVPRDQRSVTQQEYTDSIRTFLAEIPDLDVQFSEGGPMMGSAPVEVRFYSEDLAELREVTDRCAEALREIEGTRDVQTSMEIQRAQQTFVPDAAVLASLGLPRSVIGGEVSSAMMGSTPGFLREGGEEVDIFVRYAEPFRVGVEDVMAIPIMGRPLAALGRMVANSVPQTINRVNQARIATVSCSNADRPLGAVAADVEEMLDTLDTGGLRYEIAGQIKDQQETFMYLTIAIIAAAFLVYMVMASQFESFLEPFIIIFTVPMAFIGVVWTLLITGTTLSVTGMIGILMLAGIVVNNGIVLVDYANQLRESRRMGVIEAVALAGKTRLRPILMTALTTIVGMLPLAIGLGESGETWAPMARVVMGGLIVSTFLTLYVLPALYTVFGCRRKLKGEAPSCS
jgi:HAE1 family hydrophobic/amphiphilic exporter-1